MAINGYFEMRKRKDIKFVLPISILEFTGVMNRDWEEIGKKIFNSKVKNETNRRNKNQK